SGTLSMGFDTPADFQILPGMENILAAQALFPVTSRDEMRGNVGDVDMQGKTNVIALIADDNYTQIWETLFNRIWQIVEYQRLLRLAYPALNESEFNFAHIANAIAEYEIASFTTLNSPFDRYLNGEKTALSSNAINGAKLFFGKAQCGDCHTGILLTDQKYYNLGVPQLGPGKDTAAPLDFGRNLETYTEEDKFCFRTPSLRNVALTGPYMHNGAYNDLNTAVGHHLNAQEMLSTYNGEGLPAVFEASVHNNIATQQNILTTLDEHAINPPIISETEIDLLIDFLNALTDPAALDLNHTIPEQVPSGLPVFD
ncbi:MAG: cytochrome-c peroxidase, partial [Gammaproteobacteria bacterium]|nr:cytochrome-c peroxidase [Gammaproteobacteria bacterium]